MFSVNSRVSSSAVTPAAPTPNASPVTTAGDGSVAAAASTAAAVSAPSVGSVDAQPLPVAAVPVGTSSTPAAPAVDGPAEAAPLSLAEQRKKASDTLIDFYSQGVQIIEGDENISFESMGQALKQALTQVAGLPTDPDEVRLLGEETRAQSTNAEAASPRFRGCESASEIIDFYMESLQGRAALSVEQLAQDARLAELSHQMMMTLAKNAMAVSASVVSDAALDFNENPANVNAVAATLALVAARCHLRGAADGKDFTSAKEGYAELEDRNSVAPAYMLLQGPIELVNVLAERPGDLLQADAHAFQAFQIADGIVGDSPGAKIRAAASQAANAAALTATNPQAVIDAARAAVTTARQETWDNLQIFRRESPLPDVLNGLVMEYVDLPPPEVDRAMADIVARVAYARHSPDQQEEDAESIE